MAARVLRIVRHSGIDRGALIAVRQIGYIDPDILTLLVNTRFISIRSAHSPAHIRRLIEVVCQVRRAGDRELRKRVTEDFGDRFLV